jgi:hypothetical protein
MSRRLGQRVKYGMPCLCNQCKEPKVKTEEYFYFEKNGNIKNYTCKSCYYEIEKERLYKRRAKSKSLDTKIQELRHTALLEKVKTRTFPKGHPMNPTKEQRAALIEKIENRRVYKNEPSN